MINLCIIVHTTTEVRYFDRMHSNQIHLRVLLHPCDFGVHGGDNPSMVRIPRNENEGVFVLIRAKLSLFLWEQTDIVGLYCTTVMHR